MRLLSCCLLLLTACLGCCGLVQVLPAVSTVYVLEGTRLVLQCTTRSDKTEHVDWMVRSDSVTDQHFKIVTTVQDDKAVKTTNVTAIKEHAVMGDSDTYLCIAGNIQKTKNVEVFQVRVQNASIQRGKHSELRCDPVSTANEKDWTVTWFYGESPLVESGGLQGKYRFYDRNTTLIIRTPTDGDAGLYKCRLTIHQGTPNAQNFVVYSELNGAPFVPLDIPISSVRVLKPHKQLDILCPVQGYPEPYITWWHQNQQIKACEHMWPDSHIGQPQRKLHIHDFSCSEAGMYTCQGRNAYGHASKSFTFHCNSARASLRAELSSLAGCLAMTFVLVLKMGWSSLESLTSRRQC